MAASPQAPLQLRRPPFPFLLGALMVLSAGAVTGASSSSSSSLPPPAKLGCWFVEEAARGGSVMPSNLNQRPALLILPPPGRRIDEADLESELPPEVEAGLAFQILDPSGIMWGGGSPGVSRPLWLGDGPDPKDAAEGTISCEVNAYTPQEAHVPWAAGLVGQKGCPRSLEGGKWFIATVQSPEAGYGVSAILHSEEPSLPPSPSKHQDGVITGSVVTTATAVLSVFTRTPLLQTRLGQDVTIDCGFSGPASPFSVEWRHQHGGAGRVVLAYDGAAGKVLVAEEGARLFLDPDSSNVSLQLQTVGVRHEGTYICTVYLPHLHAQQAVELRVLEPPKVSLHPAPLMVAPYAHPEVACEISGHYPQSVSVVWRRRGPGDVYEDLLSTWESGHRQSADGTYSFTSYARLGAVRAEDHGASVSCHITHPALGEGSLRKSVTLHVAGSSGPSMEDAIGCFLIAFALFGFLQAFFRRVFGEKTKSEKLE